MAQKVLDIGSNAAFLTVPHSWVLGKVSSYDIKSKTYTCTTKEPEPMMVDKIKNTPDTIWAPRQEYLEEEPDDLMSLTELHEASILFCLKRRYFKDIVYTNIGPIVVALNPFSRTIPWYMDDKMGAYLREGMVIENNLPHSWAVAHNTYWEMRENKMNQTILVSGESGAGKTEAAKIVVKYLGCLSTLHGTVEQVKKCEIVNEQVNAASPILEAFGNAKTERNDNSSRFGKFAKIQFDRDGFLVGCFCIKYLLEKSRIISAAKNERVYHSFYQLAQGGERGEDAKFPLIRNVNVHKMLKAGDCIVIPGVHDDQDFALTKQAMVKVGITEAEDKSIWRIVAGVLFFQNLDFMEAEEKGGKVASIDPSLQLTVTRAAELWKISCADLEKELVSSTIVARGEVTIRNFTKVQAQDCRDTVSKNLYDWLFDWLVRKINTTTNQEGQCDKWIGLLDIFGFEDFEQNSFEQLCINLANETLQNHYNNFIFTEDMKECQEEGIDTTMVTFVDNKPCIDLLLAKGGIFSILDDECAINGSDKGYLMKLNEKFLGTKQKEGNKYYVPVMGKAMDNHFRVRHYAGEVQYCTDNFLDKNRDTMKDAMRLVLSKSEDDLVRKICPVVEDQNRPTAKVTVGGYFSRQLSDLMALINSTNPHWIRCVKPHKMKAPRMFSHSQTMTQLCSAGVLDTVKVRKAGFPIRFKNDLFLKRYKILIPRGETRSDPKVIINNIFKELLITPAIGQLGKTKVFMRQDAFLKLNHAKDEATKRFALIFQAAGRAHFEVDGLFRQYVLVNKAKLLAERKMKEEALRRQKEEAERRKKAEEDERKRQENAAKQARFKAAVTIQRHVRGFLTRLSVVLYFVETGRATEEHAEDLEFDQYRTYFNSVDRRVSSLEQRHFQNEKMKSKFAATEDKHVLRRQKQLQQREQTLAAIEERKRLIQAQQEKELKAEKAKQKEVALDKKTKKMDADMKLREKKKTQLALRELQEEQSLQQLERRTAELRSKRAKAVDVGAEVDAAFQLKVEQLLRPQTVGGSNVIPLSAASAAVAAGFPRAKMEWAAREEWEAVREQRFEEEHLHVRAQRERLNRYHAASVAGGQVPVASPVSLQSPGQRLRHPPSGVARPSDLLSTFSPKEERLEAEYRNRRAQEAAEHVETQSMLAGTRSNQLSLE